jgi:hypothetical protein
MTACRPETLWLASRRPYSRRSPRTSRIWPPLLAPIHWSRCSAAYSGEARTATPASRTWAHHVIGHSAGGVRDGRYS